MDLSTQNYTILDRYFQNEKYTRMFQVIFALAFGIVLSHWGSGLFFLVVFLIFYEIAFYLFTGGNPKYWDSFTRAGVIMASIDGWIIGRTILEDNILQEGVPT